MAAATKGYNTELTAIKANKAYTMEEEYEAQQELYTKYAEDYDRVRYDDEYQGPEQVCALANQLLGGRKDAKILDYGCGTGYLVDILLDKYGFENVDGSEPCEGLLNVGRRNGKMKNTYVLGSNDDHSVMGSKVYDIILAVGVFFNTPSHPVVSDIPKLCKLVKSGGWIVLSTCDGYLKPRMIEEFEQLVVDGHTKNFTKETFDDYRKVKPEEREKGITTIKGALMKMQVP
ncbi:uncharacterized protein [Clytia hemisphaerica]|uniref:Methyltransferase domain-containing protein n=1 Tax=Clytia hemisphaerica TaxID=252671 RepID=A0A7M5XHB6_9CNID